MCRQVLQPSKTLVSHTDPNFGRIWQLGNSKLPSKVLGWSNDASCTYTKKPNWNQIENKSKTKRKPPDFSCFILLVSECVCQWGDQERFNSIQHFKSTCVAFNKWKVSTYQHFNMSHIFNISNAKGNFVRRSQLVPSVIPGVRI